MTEIKIQNGCRWKRPDKKYVYTWKGTRNLIIVPKMYCNVEYWRPAKRVWMVQKYKQLQIMYNLMHGKVSAGVMQNQANLCICRTNFILIKTEYLELFMGFENQKQKHD